MTEPIRIGNASGFYGDRFSAVQEMLTGGPLDVLTGDYLAELTMLILGRDRLKDPALGYARTFLKQLETGLGEALDRGVKIVSNAGGLNPVRPRCRRSTELADKLGLHPKIAYVEGDDLLGRAKELELGRAADGERLPRRVGYRRGLAGRRGCGRHRSRHRRLGDRRAGRGASRLEADQYDELAGAVVAGHVIECGCQATGGNYAFFNEIRDFGRPGFPIAEIHADGSSVITKHDKHRRRGHDRHGQGAAAVRDHRRPVRRSGRHRADGFDRAGRGRPGPGQDLRRRGEPRPRRTRSR